MNPTLFDLGQPARARHHAAPVTWPDWPFGHLVPGAYETIFADPPWAYRMRGAGGYDKSPQAHYDCVDLADLMRLPVAKLAAADCVLWLWTTWPHLASGQALRLVEAWGFVGKTGLPWVKRTATGKLAFGTGYMFRGCTEPVILATRGAPSFDKLFTAKTRGLIDALAREHSRKPELGYELAERLVPDARRCELFARSQRDGWESWGNETNKFAGGARFAACDDGARSAAETPQMAADEADPLASCGPVGESGLPPPAGPDSQPFIDTEDLLAIPNWLRRDPATGRRLAEAPR